VTVEVESNFSENTNKTNMFPIGRSPINRPNNIDKKFYRITMNVNLRRIEPLNLNSQIPKSKELGFANSAMKTSPKTETPSMVKDAPYKATPAPQTCKQGESGSSNNKKQQQRSNAPLQTNDREAMWQPGEVKGAAKLSSILKLNTPNRMIMT